MVPSSLQFRLSLTKSSVPSVLKKELKIYIDSEMRLEESQTRSCSDIPNPNCCLLCNRHHQTPSIWKEQEANCDFLHICLSTQASHQLQHCGLVTHHISFIHSFNTLLKIYSVSDILVSFGKYKRRIGNLCYEGVYNQC